MAAEEQANLSLCSHYSRLMALKRMGIVDDYEVIIIRTAIYEWMMITDTQIRI